MICENCGKPLENNNTVVDTKEDGSIHLFCRKCSSLFGTCAMCMHTYCGFFNDPDPMPQFVMACREQRTPAGTIVEQYQIPNPDRVKRFCIDDGCKCCHEINEKPLCCRFGGYTTCSNYVELEQYNFSQDFSMLEANEN